MSVNVCSFSNANPLRMVITSWANRNANDREYQFFREFSQPGFDSFFHPIQNTDVLTVQFDSSFGTSHTVYLKNYYTDATINSGAASEIDDRTTYKVWEKAISISGLDGYYYVQVDGVDAGGNFTAISEPLDIRPTHCHTVKIEYYGDESSFGIDYENSSVQFDLRIPAFFNRTADTIDQESFTDTGGNRSLISAKGTRARILKASQLLPQWLIEKVNIALIHDNCEIDDVVVSAEQSWPYELLSDRQLWSEPEAAIILASGSSAYLNIYS